MKNMRWGQPLRRDVFALGLAAGFCVAARGPDLTRTAPPAVYANALVAPDPGPAYFRSQLSQHGTWILADDHEWYWRPKVAVRGWRPYWDGGHWVRTDAGWYWASDYPWGWAAFHYGRWRLHPRLGWLWRPDRVWSPAWVVWRTGGDYCGWAPLPPGAVFDVRLGVFLFRGVRVGAGFDFGLGWDAYAFCSLSELGRPRLHARFNRPEELRAAFARTTVAGRYEARRVLDHGVARIDIVHRGVEPERAGAAGGRRVDTVRLVEHEEVARARNGDRVDTRRGALEFYRPRREIEH